jgi:dephospho-CoA kinase
MLSVALTGNIGAGKSTVAELFQGWGATIIDADQLVRELQAPGQPVLAEIARRFGPEVIASDGNLDREHLRARILSDGEALALLNRIVHPAVHRRRRELLEQARRRGDRVVISMIPLLFEAGDPAEFDAVILVDAPEPIRRERLLGSRKIMPAELDRLMAVQLSPALKRPASDYIIENDGDHPALQIAARNVWQALLARA